LVSRPLHDTLHGGGYVGAAAQVSNVADAKLRILVCSMMQQRNIRAKGSRKQKAKMQCVRALLGCSDVLVADAITITAAAAATGLELRHISRRT
jgi:hypothetical protein